MKARQSVLLVATLLCSVAPVCAMNDDVVAGETTVVNAVEMAKPEVTNDDMGMAVADENATPQLPQEKMVKKPVAAEAPVAEVAMEEAVTPAGVSMEAEEASMNGGDNNADVRGVFEEMSREEAGDQADEVDHIG